jgi:hypothetical protein
MMEDTREGMKSGLVQSDEADIERIISKESYFGKINSLVWKRLCSVMALSVHAKHHIKFVSKWSY